MPNNDDRTRHNNNDRTADNYNAARFDDYQFGYHHNVDGGSVNHHYRTGRHRYYEPGHHDNAAR